MNFKRGRVKVEELIENRGQVCSNILHALPEWFQIEKSIQDYTLQVEKLPTFVVKIENKIVGFLTLKIHTFTAAEILVTGVVKEHQRKGVGKALLEKAEEYLREKGYMFLTVKTLSPSVEDENYAKTRYFYQAAGFYPLEEFKHIWDENNPCLYMIKPLKLSKWRVG